MPALEAEYDALGDGDALPPALPLALPPAEVLEVGDGDGDGELLAAALPLPLALWLALALTLTLAVALAVVARVSDGEADDDGCSDALAVAEPDAAREALAEPAADALVEVELCWLALALALALGDGLLLEETEALG